MTEPSANLIAYAEAWLQAYTENPSVDPMENEAVSMGQLTFKDAEYMGTLMGNVDVDTVNADSAGRLALLQRVMKAILAAKPA